MSVVASWHQAPCLVGATNDENRKKQARRPRSKGAGRRSGIPTQSMGTRSETGGWPAGRRRPQFTTYSTSRHNETVHWRVSLTAINGVSPAMLVAIPVGTANCPA